MVPRLAVKDLAVCQHDVLDTRAVENLMLSIYK